MIQNRKNCPLCQSNTNVIFNVDDHPVQECENCAHRFYRPQTSGDHIQEVYGDDYFEGGGAGYEDYCCEEDLLKASGERYASIVNRHIESGRIVDVGAAAGYLLEGFQRQGWKGFGVEPNEKMSLLARERGIEVVNSSFEAFCDSQKSENDNRNQSDHEIDLVTMIQVFAHFENPFDIIQRTSELLRPGKLLLIETWDRRSMTARCFGKRWHEYSPPSVLHWFSRESLDELVLQNGFEKIAKGRPSKWIKFGHGLSLIRHKMGGTAAGRIATAPLGLVPKNLKVPYPLDDVFWALYRRT